MPVVTIHDLLEAGVHFGHQTRRWNPKMNKFIFGQRNGIYIIDLQQTLRQILRAYALVRDSVAAGGEVLFVGTKKQAQEAVAREAQRCGMYYVNNRWLGGTLTNFATIQKSVRRFVELEDLDKSGKLDALSKKEASRLRKQKLKLEKNLSGIKTMSRLPAVLFVIDTRKEAIAVREAQRMGIPCIGIVDTNADPDAVPVPIPGNDDAIRAVNLFCSVMANAALEGKAQKQKPDAPRPKPAAAPATESPPPEPESDVAGPVEPLASDEDAGQEDEPDAEE